LRGVGSNGNGAAVQPGLVFFFEAASGRCRRVEGFLAQVLQRRHNHHTFKLYRVNAAEQPDLLERFRVESTPTLAVVEGRKLRGKLPQPSGCKEIEDFLSPWLV
jgi:thioredoxin-like negative regulator of GroEL